MWSTPNMVLGVEFAAGLPTEESHLDQIIACLYLWLQREVGERMLSYVSVERGTRLGGLREKAAASSAGTTLELMSIRVWVVHQARRSSRDFTRHQELQVCFRFFVSQDNYSQGLFFLFSFRDSLLS